MISPSSFSISIQASLELLKDWEIYKGKGVKPIGQYSDESIKVSKSNCLTQIYDVAIKNNDYEALIFDDSIFQFSRRENTLRYAFIQNPNIYLTKDDFINSIYSFEDLLKISADEYDELIKGITEEEFSQYLNEQGLNSEAHIIRYDFDYSGYNPLVHSCSHIHIGSNSNLRIPCSKILTPLKFTIFAIKNTYYSHWKNIVSSNEKIHLKIQESKNMCTNISSEYWSKIEEYDLFLN